MDSCQQTLEPTGECPCSWLWT